VAFEKRAFKEKQDVAIGKRRPIRVSAVIPARNEAGNIAWVLERMPLEVDEIVLVDGRSWDRTIEVALAVCPDAVIVDDAPPGKGSAIRRGIERATGDFIVMLDADGSMDPQEIGRFIQPLHDGKDLVRGSRFLVGGGTEDMSVLRKAGNRMLMLAAHMLFRVKRSDLCYGYAAFRRSSVMQLDLSATGFEIEAQLFLRAQRAGFDVAEVPSYESARHAGQSNLHAVRDGWRVLRTILAERMRPPVLAVETGGVPTAQEPEARTLGSLATVPERPFDLLAGQVVRATRAEELDPLDTEIPSARTPARPIALSDWATKHEARTPAGLSK
jgi:hypothetical protein